MFKVGTKGGGDSSGLMSWISQGNKSPGLWKRLLIDDHMFMVQHSIGACVSTKSR